MLIESHLSLNTIATVEWHSAEATKQMNTTDERLVATKTECDVCREIIVWLASTLAEWVAIY